VRALLDLLRENEPAVQGMLHDCQRLLNDAIKRLKILNPELGDEELIKSVAAELSNLREMAGKGELQQRPGGA
jgi:hypothetical protein